MIAQVPGQVVGRTLEMVIVREMATVLVLAGVLTTAVPLLAGVQVVMGDQAVMEGQEMVADLAVTGVQTSMIVLEIGPTGQGMVVDRSLVEIAHQTDLLGQGDDLEETIIGTITTTIIPG